MGASSSKARGAARWRVSRRSTACWPHDARVACSWQLVLKRAIGLKKDEFFIDRRHVTKAEVPYPYPYPYP